VQEIRREVARRSSKKDGRDLDIFLGIIRDIWGY
jgi:hypothetical protein